MLFYIQIEIFSMGEFVNMYSSLRQETNPVKAKWVNIFIRFSAKMYFNLCYVVIIIIIVFCKLNKISKEEVM